MKEIYILVQQIVWFDDEPGTSLSVFNTKEDAIEAAKSEFKEWVKYFEDGGEEIDIASDCDCVETLYGEENIPGYSFCTSSDNYYQSSIRVCRI